MTDPGRRGMADVPMRRIIVGVDGSPHSLKALRWAVDKARMHDAAVEAVVAWRVPYSYLDFPLEPADEAAFRTDAVETLDATIDAANIGDAGACQTSRRVVGGQPAATLLDCARDASLLVVGSRGRSALGAVVLGSVSAQCAHRTLCPLAVVRGNAPLPSDGGDVVVGVDGSSGSARALEWAVNEAGRRDAPLVVVHAWDTPFPVPPAGIAVVPRERDVFLAQSRRLLEDMVEKATATGRRMASTVELLPVESMASQALIERSRGAGLLVVGSRGRGGFAGLLLGSVSHQCLHHAETTVVIVPAHWGDMQRRPGGHDEAPNDR